MTRSGRYLSAIPDTREILTTHKARCQIVASLDIPEPFVRRQDVLTVL